MNNFQLSSQIKISGIGSASGLLLHQNSLYIISDNSTFLYQYSLSHKQLNKIPLAKNSKDNIAKANKLDFESITKKGKKMYIFGSGSTKKRNTMCTFKPENQKTKSHNIKDVYKDLRKFGELSKQDLNIEGAFFSKQKWFFFQRGNGANSKNGIFILDNKNETVIFNPISLPKIKNVEATFTDAILVNKTIYFLAAAEDSASTYLDGEILGTIVGSIDLKSLLVTNHQVISTKNKFEGIAFESETETEINFLLCEDNDTELLETTIYNLKLTK